jgi:hypothetical protein
LTREGYIAKKENGRSLKHSTAVGGLQQFRKWAEKNTLSRLCIRGGVSREGHVMMAHRRNVKNKRAHVNGPKKEHDRDHGNEPTGELAHRNTEDSAQVIRMTVLLGCYWIATGMLLLGWLLLECHWDATGVLLLGCYWDATGMLLGCQEAHLKEQQEGACSG